MSKPYKISRSTSIVAVTSVAPGDIPTIRVVYHSENSRGVARQFVRQIPVPDVALFGRIQTSVKEGDQIEATTVNEWYDTGYVSYLADFQKVSGVEPEPTVNNGTFDLVRNNMTQIIVPPVREPKTKAHH